MEYNEDPSSSAAKAVVAKRAKTRAAVWRMFNFIIVAKRCKQEGCESCLLLNSVVGDALLSKNCEAVSGVISDLESLFKVDRMNDDSLRVK